VNETRFVTLTSIVGLVFVAAVYLPAVGQGFVKDDFRWLADARTALAEPARAVLPRLPNFYRPVVTASFAADYALFGLDARAYGLTNLALYIACAAAICSLLRAAGLGRAPAAAGALAWALNPHGINMAVVWLSGRTSLLLTLFAVVSMLAFLRGRRWIGAAWLLAALFSKEEAVALPFVFLVWLFALGSGEEKDRFGRIHDALALFAPLVVYIAARAQTPALMPSTAPSFYRLTADPRVVGVNALSYFDRSVTFFAFMTLVAGVAYGLASIRARLHRDLPLGAAGPTRLPQLLAAGLAWLVGGYAVTVCIPVGGCRRDLRGARRGDARRERPARAGRSAIRRRACGHARVRSCLSAPERPLGAARPPFGAHRTGAYDGASRPWLYRRRSLRGRTGGVRDVRHGARRARLVGRPSRDEPAARGPHHPARPPLDWTRGGTIPAHIRTGRADQLTQSVGRPSYSASVFTVWAPFSVHTA